MKTEDRKAYQLQYQEKNKDHIAAQTAEYREQNKDALAVQHAQYYEKNKDHIAAQHVAYRERNKKYIAAQKAVWREKNKEHIATQKSAHYEKNKKRLVAESVARTRKRNLALRIKFYDMYGLKKEGHEHGVCSCSGCGADLMMFGTVSHIDGSGAQHRRLVGRQTIRILKEAVSVYNPARFAAECWNCNSGAAHNGGICPHKAESLKRPDSISDSHMVVGAVR